MSGKVVALSQAAALRRTAWWGQSGAPPVLRQAPNAYTAWSTISLDGLIFPGVASPTDAGAVSVRVQGEGIGYRIDRQEEKNGDGASTSTEGYRIKPFTLMARFHRAEQWEAFRAYLSLINPKLKPKNRHAFSVDAHPILTTYGIQAICIENIGFPDEADHKMVMRIPILVSEVFRQSGTGAKRIAETDINAASAFIGLNPAIDLDASPGAR